MVVKLKKFLESRRDDLEVVKNTLWDMTELDETKKYHNNLWDIINLIQEIRDDEIED